MKPILEDIQVLVGKLAPKINAPSYLLPTFGGSTDEVKPYVEIDNVGQLYYVVLERGEEVRRDYAVDTDDLLYKIFADITFSLACDYELKHRIPTQDFRRQLFAKQEELLGILDGEWKLRAQKNHVWIVESHPFIDEI